jgi:hypothetical protein
MVRKAGLEPACLSAPPPQDGVSANSTTSAGDKLHGTNDLALCHGKDESHCTRFCTDPAPPTSVRSSPPSRSNKLAHRLFLRIDVAPSRFYRIVSRHILQREGFGVSPAPVRKKV